MKDNARLRSTTGDIEFGSFYTVPLDRISLRYGEIGPFYFNRVATSDVDVYQSLGYGVGLHAGVRDAVHDDSLFLRLTLLSPSDDYSDRYGLDRERDSIVELTAGYEAALYTVGKPAQMRRRMTADPIIVLRVPHALLRSDGDDQGDRRHGERLAIVHAYLDQVAQLNKTADNRRPPDPARVLMLIERVTQQPIGSMRWLILRSDFIHDPELRVAHRRQIVGEVVREGLIELMRERHPLVLVSDGLDDPDGRVGLHPPPTAQAMRPGMAVSSDRDGLNIDVMIDDYAAHVAEQVR